MQFISAFKLVRKLSAIFYPVQHNLLEDISNAFYNPRTEYKDVVQKVKERALYKGFTNEFSEMLIKDKSDPKEEKGNANAGKNAKKQESQCKQAVLKILEEEGPNAPNTKLNAHSKIRQAIDSYDFCILCMGYKCRQTQIEDKKLGKKHNPECQTKGFFTGDKNL